MEKHGRLLKTALVLSAFFISSQAGAMQVLPESTRTITSPALPPSLSSYSRTATLEWGCPVSDQVQASTQDEAVNKVRSECMEEVTRAAARKPGVMNVITTRVVFPDIQVKELSGAFHLQGTLFLETVVLQRLKPGER